MYQNLFFDLDGTLINPKEGITKSFQFSLSKMEVEVPSADQLEWCIGPPLKASFSQLLKSTCQNLIDKAIEYYRAYFSEIGIFQNILYPGVEQMLQNFCQEECRLFIATSKPQVFAHKILQHFGMDHYFDDIYGAELDGTRSDKGDLLKYIIDVNGKDLSSVMIGDRKYDIEAARQNGFLPLGVTYGFGSEKELIESGAHFLCHSPSEIFTWFSEISYEK